MQSAQPSASTADEVFDDDEMLQGILAQIAQEEQQKAATPAAPSSSSTASPQPQVSKSTKAMAQRQQQPSASAAPSAASALQTSHSDHVEDADEETRLQTLVQLTAGTPSFHKAAEPPSGSSSSPPLQGDAAASQKSKGVQDKHKATGQTTRPAEASWSLQEEEKVLQSILDAIHCQQSSVSGDLAADPRSQKVEDVLERAELVASANVVATEARRGTRSAHTRNGKGDHVLHFHEHIALKSQLEKMSSSLGRPTCSSLVPLCAGAHHTDVPTSSATTTTTTTRATIESDLHVAIGTSLGVVVLMNEHWVSLGVLGSVEPETVRARSAVVSVAVTEDRLTCASGHAKGVFILWSTAQLTAVRVLSDEFTASIMSIRALHSDSSKFLALDASGTLRLLRPSRVMGATMMRTTSIVQPKTFGTPLADFDVVPYPSSAYLMDTNSCVSSADTAGVPVIFSPLLSQNATPVSSRAPELVVPDRHLIACVFSDTVLVYALDQSSSNPVARHTHPPTSSLSNELIQFIPTEQGRPELRLCVSWNTELELLRVRFDIAGQVPTVVPELERLATVRHPAPIITLCAVAGCNVVYVDQEHRATLMDATVAVEAERPALSQHLDILSFTHRLCGVKYKGAMSTNRDMVLAVGRNTAFSITVLPWYARLDALLERQQFPKALELLQSFTQEVALSTVGMSSQAATRRKALSAYMTKVSVAYVKSVCAQNSARALVTATSEVLTRCCSMDMTPAFYGPVMTALREARKQDVALYSLESGMLHGLVTTLPEPLIDAFYGLFTDSARLAAVEEISTVAPALVDSARLEADAVHPAVNGKTRAENALLHLEDGLDRLLALAEDHQLVRLRVCVLSLRQGQYVAALDAALSWDATQQPPSSSSSSSLSSSSFSSAAVEYVSATLQGLSMVAEIELPLERRAEAKRLLWVSFFERGHTSGQRGGSTSAPLRLETLVRLDARRTVQALLVSLAEVGPCNPWSTWTSPASTTTTTTESAAAARLTALVQVLACLVAKLDFATNVLGTPGETRAAEGSDVVVDEDGRRLADAPFFHVYDVAQRSWPPYSVVDQYLTGVAQLLAASESPLLVVAADEGAATPTSCAAPQSVVWPRLAGCLASHFTYLFRTAQDDQQRHRHQDALIQCMRAPVFARVSFRSFEGDFKRNNMARAAAALLCDAGEYDAAIDSFLDDDNGRLEPGLAKQVFAMLSTEMGRLSAISAATRAGDDNASDTLAKTAHKRAKTFTARLRRAVMDHVPVLVKVDATALAHFVFEYLPSNNADVIKVLRKSSDTFLKYLDELIAKRDPAVLSDMSLQNTYIELLSAYDASKVLPYLERQGTAITYDVQQALRAVKRYHVADAAIYLLERMNRVPEAMHTLYDVMRRSLTNLRTATIEEVRGLYAAPVLRSGATAAVGEPGDSTNGSAEASQASLPRRSAVAGARSPVGASANSNSTSTSTSNNNSSLFEQRYTLTTMAPLVRTADTFFTLGESLCSTYDSRSGNAGNYWFQLLDIFATPRRLLAQRLDQHEALTKQQQQQQKRPSAPNSPVTPVATTEAFAFDEMATAFAAASTGVDGDEHAPSHEHPSSPLLVTSPPLTLPLSAEEVCYTATMIDILTSYSSSLLHGMIDVLDMTTVVEKVVKDHEQERFEPFRPIILDVMSSIRFNVKAHRLAQTCAVDDVVRLGRNLYQQLNRGAIPRTDTCCLCHEALSGIPSVVDAAAAASSGGALALSRSVLVFGACGHPYHEVCAQHWKATTQSRRCPQCTRRRLGELAEASDDAALSARADRDTRVKTELAPAPALDDAAWQRRLRIMRARMSNHSSAYYDVLKGSIGNSVVPSRAAASTTSPQQRSTEALPSGKQRSTGPRLVLSPPAPPAAPATQLTTRNKPAVDLTRSVTETLTDADILELFGG